MRVLVGEHFGLDVAEGSVRLVPDAVVERLDDAFLAAAAEGMRLHHRPRSARPSRRRNWNGEWPIQLS
jgi:hypothetical protein